MPDRVLPSDTSGSTTPPSVGVLLHQIEQAISDPGSVLPQLAEPPFETRFEGEMLTTVQARWARFHLIAAFTTALLAHYDIREKS